MSNQHHHHHQQHPSNPQAQPAPKRKMSSNNLAGNNQEPPPNIIRTSVTPTASSNTITSDSVASNAHRVELIRQYYAQLMNSLKNVTMQLNAVPSPIPGHPDPNVSRRQMLLTQQDRLRRALNEFTERVAKKPPQPQQINQNPISDQQQPQQLLAQPAPRQTASIHNKASSIESLAESISPDLLRARQSASPAANRPSSSVQVNLPASFSESSLPPQSTSNARPTLPLKTEKDRAEPFIKGPPLPPISVSEGIDSEKAAQLENLGMAIIEHAILMAKERASSAAGNVPIDKNLPATMTASDLFKSIHDLTGKRFTLGELEHEVGIGNPEALFPAASMASSLVGTIPASSQKRARSSQPVSAMPAAHSTPSISIADDSIEE